jgi:hypothetical protein
LSDDTVVYVLGESFEVMGRELFGGFGGPGNQVIGGGEGGERGRGGGSGDGGVVVVVVAVGGIDAVGCDCLVIMEMPGQ